MRFCGTQFSPYFNKQMEVSWNAGFKATPNGIWIWPNISHRSQSTVLCFYLYSDDLDISPSKNGKTNIQGRLIWLVPQAGYQPVTQAYFFVNLRFLQKGETYMRWSICIYTRICVCIYIYIIYIYYIYIYICIYIYMYICVYMYVYINIYVVYVIYPHANPFNYGTKFSSLKLDSWPPGIPWAHRLGV